MQIELSFETFFLSNSSERSLKLHLSQYDDPVNFLDAKVAKSTTPSTLTSNSLSNLLASPVEPIPA